MNNYNNHNNGDGIVYCSLDSLLKQRIQAKRLQYGRRNIHARQTGNHPSFYKGHGMIFAESRQYQAGDDVRLLDWRLTARTGKAYTKLFEEEKEQPFLVWLDLRPPMFFATRGCYKSVMAAQLASVLLWKNWLEGDRVGGVIVNVKGNTQGFKPSRRLSALSRLLQAIATATQENINRQTVQNKPFIDALEPLNSLVERGGQIVFISDFRGVNQQVTQRLQQFQRRSTLFLLAISDPFEHQLPRKGFLRMGYQQHFLSLRLSDQSASQAYYATLKQRQQQLIELAQQLKTPLIKLSTADQALEQLLTLVRGFR